MNVVQVLVQVRYHIMQLFKALQTQYAETNLIIVLKKRCLSFRAIRTAVVLKGFIDKVFLPGFGFQYRNGSVWWDKLLKGRSARLIVTMDTPPWYFRWIYGRPGHNAMKKAILEFCGVKPVKICSIGPVKSSTTKKRAGWLNNVQKLGEKLT